MKKKIIAVLTVLMFLGLSACSVPLLVAYGLVDAPTYTPLPTYTLFPSLTPTVHPTATATVAGRRLTWSDLNQFLADDHTNWNEYVPDVYNCVNFAMDLAANAEAQHIQVWLVSVEFDNGQSGHAFVAFNTTDKGVVWVEPQSDYAYDSVEVGKQLCLKIDPTKCNKQWGTVTKVTLPAECDPKTHECWAK